MARDALDRKISLLKDEVLLQGSKVEGMILDAVAALVARDQIASRQILALDQQINEKHQDIEKQCLSLITTEPPILAKDLRLLTALLEVNTMLERFGDYAKGIARTGLSMAAEPTLLDLTPLSNLSAEIIDYSHQALGAFITENKDNALEVPCTLDQIRSRINQLVKEYLSLMIDDPQSMNQANKLLWVIHILERIAERVIDICERTIYISTGDLTSIKTPLLKRESE